MTPPPAALAASLQQLAQLQREQRYPELADALWRLLMALFSAPYTALSSDEEKLFDLLGKLILKIFADLKFHIPDALAFDYLNCTTLIAHLVSQSEFKTTDLVLKLLLEQQAPLHKILPLYSFRNEVALDIEDAFAREPKLVFGWMTNVLMHGHPACLASKQSEWCRRLLGLKALRERSDFIGTRRYYQLLLSTYIDPAQDREVKTAINRAFKAQLPAVPPPANPRMNKVLVVSCMMHPKHAVYRSMHPLIESLRGSYELITIAPPEGTENPSQHPEWTFNHVLPRILREEAGIIIYPDIGLDLLSVELSNLRLAPIQLTMYGHPVSSFASEIDYIIASRDAEIPAAVAAHYSERAVLIPGLAAISVAPDYQLRRPKRRPEHEGKIVINCFWGALKLNSRMIAILKKIVERSDVPLLFRFSDIWVQYFSFLPIRRELESLLGREHVECLPPLTYGDYMALIEEGDFALDSYPFCGFNRTVDTLFCGKPIVALEGDAIYNRIGGYILRKIGLGELATADEEAFIATVLRLAQDDAWRRELTARVEALDLKQSVCNTESAPYFKMAVDTLVQRHEEFRRQPSKAPILIPCAAA